MKFYVPENTKYTIFDSIKDSVNYTLTCGLTEFQGNRCAKSTFLDPEGNIAEWHEFGLLEGVGWAANSVGGSYELYLYGEFMHNETIKKIAVSVLKHSLTAGFIDYQTGFITPYRDTVTNRLYLNYLRNNEWVCMGSIAKIGYQFLIYSDLIKDTKLKQQMVTVAKKLTEWIYRNVKLAPNGWFPRRSTPEGNPVEFNAFGTQKDPQYDHSADGMFILQLMTELTRRGIDDYRELVKEKASLYINNGGFYGSINHDVYDENEDVAYAVTFRVLNAIAKFFNDDNIRQFAYTQVLPALTEFEMCDDRNGVATTGLLWMAKTWDTAYLWENAEVSLAYLEAYTETGSAEFLGKGLTILRAIAKHHHGKYGFLTEGVDWNNHNGIYRDLGDRKIPIHVGGVEFGDVNFTQPFLNNLHITEPTIFYLTQIAIQERDEIVKVTKYYDYENNLVVTLSL